jgi:anti-sigma-K factor RskA
VSWILAAACLVLALAGGLTAAHFHESADRAQALNQRITAVLTAPDAQAATARTQGDATVTVVSSRSRNTAVITAARLDRLPPAKTYQLWFLGAASPRSAGVLRPSADRPVIASGLGDARQMAITVEPAGGSPQPTNAPFLTLRLG